MQTDHDYPNGTVTGTSTSAYVTALTIENCAGAVINVKNTGASWDLYYKITGYVSAHASALSTAVKAETTLAEATASGLLTDVNYPNAKVLVQVMSAESTATTWQIDWIAY